MKLLCFSVFDKAVNAYLPPFQTRSVGEAIRSFTDAVNNREHQFNKHATDYVLFSVGDFNDTSGVFDHCEPQRVIGATEVLVDDIFPPDKQVR